MRSLLPAVSAALIGGCAALNVPETDLRVREIITRTGVPEPSPARAGEAASAPGKPATLEEVSARLLSGPRLTLDKLITAAIVNSPELRAFSLDVRITEADLLQARLYPNPVFSVEGEGFSLGGEKEITWSIRQAFLLGGKYETGIELGKRDVEVAGLKFRTQKFAVLTAVKRAFWEVWADRERAKVVRELLEIARAAASTVEKRVSAGSATRADLLRAQITVATTEVRLSQVESRLIGSWKALAAAAGVPDLAPRELEPPERPSVDYRLDDLVEKATLTNSEVTAARAQERRAESAFARARAEAFPDVTVGAGFRFGIDEGRGAGAFLGEVAIPLWNRNQGGIRSAAAKRDRAAADTAAVVNRLHGETAAAFAAFAGAKSHLEFYEKKPNGILTMSREAFELTRAAYEQGRFSLIDVLATQETYINAVLAHIDAQVDFRKALVDIHKVIQFDEYEPAPAVAPGAAIDR